jgi:DNA-binding response OmpR family regulator
MKILIVDDKPNLARVTAVALRTLDCQSITATTTAAAVALLATEKVDAVFLDVNLGGESGLDFLSKLKAQSFQPPIIIFTSYTRDEVAREAVKRGAFDCLTKPFTLDDLREQLARIKQHSPPAGETGGRKPDAPQP